MGVGPGVRLALVAVAALVIQTTLLAQIRWFAVAPDGLLLLTIAFGLVAGPDRGAVAGFILGLGIDLYLLTPFGLSALAYWVTGYAVGVAMATVPDGNRLIRPVAIVAGSVGGVLLYVGVGAVLGQDHLVSDHLVAVVAVVLLANLAMSPLAIRTAGWVEGVNPPRRNRRRTTFSGAGSVPSRVPSR